LLGARADTPSKRCGGAERVARLRKSGHVVDSGDVIATVANQQPDALRKQQRGV
jgi:hypothetical protein